VSSSSNAAKRAKDPSREVEMADTEISNRETGEASAVIDPLLGTQQVYSALLAQ
jgi:hypothetical protein